MEAVSQQIVRHFLPVPAPRDGWTHSNLRFPSLTLYSASTVIIFFSFLSLIIFFSFLLFAFCNAAWEHRLTLYPWPDSWTKNSSHSAARVQSHRRQAAAGNQGGQVSPCSLNQTHERSMEDFVCLPPLKTAEQGQEIGTGAQWAKINFLCSWHWLVEEVYVEVHLLGWTGPSPAGSCVLAACPPKNYAG